jgi:hypothetical protein
LTIGAGIWVNAALQNDAAPVQPPTVDSEPTFMVIPPPVKLSAFWAVLFDAKPQFGALILGLPWKLNGPVNDRAHGCFGKLITWATAVAAMVTVEIPSTPARYVGCVWLTVARTKVPPFPFHVASGVIVTVCEIPVGRLATHWEPG